MYTPVNLMFCYIKVEFVRVILLQGLANQVTFL